MGCVLGAGLQLAKPLTCVAYFELRLIHLDGRKERKSEGTAIWEGRRECADEGIIRYTASAAASVLFGAIIFELRGCPAACRYAGLSASAPSPLGPPRHRGGGRAFSRSELPRMGLDEHGRQARERANVEATQHQRQKGARRGIATRGRGSEASIGGSFGRRMATLVLVAIATSSYRTPRNRFGTRSCRPSRRARLRTARRGAGAR